MGRGWRRAFCTTIPTEKRETAETQQELGLFSTTTTASNPTTPRLQSSLRCRTFPDRHSQQSSSDPKLKCNTKSPKPAKFGSNPSSPRSPFTILKNTLRLSRNGCGVCMQSVKTGQGMAIYTAECGHAFHFPCIASHVRKQGKLICTVCNVTWKDVPLLSNFHQKSNSYNNNNDNNQSEPEEKKKIIKQDAISASAPATPTGTNRVHFEDKRISSLSSIRCYNDDEPLLSPRFNPIPEAPEETDEFQGFFVNNNPPPPTTPKNKVVDPYGLYNKNVELNVSVKLLPEVAVVSACRSYETYALALRVKAPSASAAILSPTRRAPVDLVTVLDVSGSMTGAKLQMLKRAMRLVISSLSSADRLAIVAFSSSPKRLLPLKRMTSSGQKLARRIIDQLTTGQGTSVGEALRKAAKVLEDRREKNPVASIMLLSDGHDERVSSGAGNQRQGSGHVSSARFAHIEIPVHSSGYGFRTHAPAEDAFTKCVGGLLSVVVKDLRVQLGFASGSAQAEVMAVYSCNSRPSLMNSDSVRLGDLYAEEERELLIELKVPTSALGSHHVMSVRCSYRDPLSQEPMYGRERALLVPRPHAVRSSDPRVERLRNVFIYTRALAESRRLVDHGDFTSAHHLIASAKALVLQSPVPSGVDYAKELEAELAQVHWRKQCHAVAQAQVNTHALVDESGEPLTPTSAWREAERLAKVAIIKKSLNRSVSDLHGFENARF